MFQNDKLKLCDVVRVHPVLCRLANKVLLLSSSGRVAFDGVSTGPYVIIELGQLYNESIVVVLVKWFLS
jgi:hypothetical protein